MTSAFTSGVSNAIAWYINAAARQLKIFTGHGYHRAGKVLMKLDIIVPYDLALVYTKRTLATIHLEFGNEYVRTREPFTSLALIYGGSKVKSERRMGYGRN